MRIMKVYQTVSQDNEGSPIPSNEFFSDLGEAKKQCNGWGAPPDPIVRNAVLLDDGKIWLLEREPMPLYHSVEDMERKKALEKLSEREKKLLGIK